MTQEERNAIRVRYKRYAPTKGAPCWSAFTGACPAKQDIPTLLDELEEVEYRTKKLHEENKRLQSAFDDVGFTTEEMAEIIRAAVDKRLIILPAPIGGKIFVPAVYEEDGRENAEVEVLTLSGYIKEGDRAFYTTYDAEHGSCDVEPDDVFLTCKEAEAALTAQKGCCTDEK